MNVIRSFEILSMLLDYPSQELIDNLAEIPEAVAEDGVVVDDDYALLGQFLQWAGRFAGVRDWQERYVQLFDTNSKSSLYLFDMVYGNGRERGQAMVDLKNSYLKAGLTPREDELPDYLPVFLEFVAVQPGVAQALALLHEVNGVLTAMEKNFERVEHPYLPLISILKHLSTQAKPQ